MFVETDCQHLRGNGTHDVKKEKVAAAGRWDRLHRKVRVSGRNERERRKHRHRWGFLTAGEVKGTEIERGTWGPGGFTS